jgi:hypothetical protein
MKLTRSVAATLLVGGAIFFCEPRAVFAQSQPSAQQQQLLQQFQQAFAQAQTPQQRQALLNQYNQMVSSQGMSGALGQVQTGQSSTDQALTNAAIGVISNLINMLLQELLSGNSSNPAQTANQIANLGNEAAGYGNPTAPGTTTGGNAPGTTGTGTGTTGTSGGNAPGTTGTGTTGTGTGTGTGNGPGGLGGATGGTSGTGANGTNGAGAAGADGTAGANGTTAPGATDGMTSNGAGGADGSTAAGSSPFGANTPLGGSSGGYPGGVGGGVGGVPSVTGGAGGGGAGGGGVGGAGGGGSAGSGTDAGYTDTIRGRLAIFPKSEAASVLDLRVSDLPKKTQANFDKLRAKVKKTDQVGLQLLEVEAQTGTWRTETRDKPQGDCAALEKMSRALASLRGPSGQLDLTKCDVWLVADWKSELPHRYHLKASDLDKDLAALPLGSVVSLKGTVTKLTVDKDVSDELKGTANELAPKTIVTGAATPAAPGASAKDSSGKDSAAVKPKHDPNNDDADLTQQQ